MTTSATSTAGLARPLHILNEEIVHCSRCPRLVAHREEIGRVQKRAYRGQEYWSRPVPGFGDPFARLLIMGLAPGAHGSNRTGRAFTGDRSGEFLYRALWETGFANQPHSISRDDGLVLKDAYIVASVRCVPPDNKPLREETLACRPFLVRELALLPQVRVVVALGGIALDAYLSVLQDSGLIRSRAPFRFAHGAAFETHPGGPLVVCSYHPSQQNTSTGRLTAAMLHGIFDMVRERLATGDSDASCPELGAEAAVEGIPVGGKPVTHSRAPVHSQAGHKELAPDTEGQEACRRRRSQTSAGSRH
ncbi:MAG TPA: uracil-DNA glycosylase [Bryobacteraceae bacterium]|nr:uracil-DNA glycosylase [Bryobacteraceae bacterium]